MPTPLGHALAGAAIALAAQRSAVVPLGRRRLIALCALLAALPDLDLLYQPIHRTYTHSVGAVLAVLIITMIATVVTGRVTRRHAILLGLLGAAAWGSHVVLDWLGTDPNPPRGLKAMWPFSDRWFISDWDVFLGTERHHLFTPESIVQNLQAIGRELLLLAPIVIVLAFVRRRELGWNGGGSISGRSKSVEGSGDRPGRKVQA